MPEAAGLFYFYYSGDGHRKSNENRPRVNDHPGGDGRPALVLLHGAGGTHLYWPPEIRRLPGCRVFAPDLPGHGKSAGEAGKSIREYAVSVRDWMGAARLEKAVIAGHSMGSAIALTLALEYPSCVAGLVLLGAGARLRVHPQILENCAREETFLTAVETINLWAFSRWTPGRMVELAKRRMAETPQQVLYSDLKACNEFDVIDRLEEIWQPALVILGEEDNLSPERYARYLAEKLPRARLEILPGAGHMLMLEKPKQVAELLKDFLDTF